MRGTSAKNVILLGPPGSGKTTQARLVAEKYGIPHIEMGELLRNLAAQPTPVAGVVRGYLEKGLLVPDDIVLELVEQRLREPACSNGFVLDGFPRDLNQAKIFERFLHSIGKKLTAAIAFEVPFQIVVDRLSKRLVCTSCGEGFPVDGTSAQAGRVCPACGGALKSRRDDRPEIVGRRLQVYARDTAAVIAYYESKGLLHRVNALGDPRDVFKRIDKVVRAQERATNIVV